MLESHPQVTIYLGLLLAAFVMVLLLAPVSIVIARRLGAIDHPEERKVHSAPVPRLGGLAIALAVWLAIFMGTLVNRYLREDTQLLWGLLLGSSIILILGVYDDIRNASPWFKLSIHFVAAGVAVWFGIRFALASNPFAAVMRDYFDLGILAIPFSILWIVGLTNAMNLIDGLDGLATGIGMFTAIALFIISVQQGAGAVTYFYAALAGACMAFLRFNRFPAKVFLGDCGSTLLGFTLACLAIKGSQKSYALSAFFIPLIVFGFPIFESISTVLRRYFSRSRLQDADDQHIHHKLLLFGLTQQQAVWILYSLTILFGIIAFSFTVLHDEYAAVIVLIIGMLGGFLGKELRVFAQERRTMERQLRVKGKTQANAPQS
jgi:UDP-GlcNAc:undecaprenyl-phosphate GlcNAc-1-phosphate transferase